MKITSIDLDNIKSYRRQTIHLTDGVNAIAGHNGSGKTTILEAIGFALFDFLPYPQSAFLREGEKSGAVRVRLQLNDGREYEVVRRVGSGAFYHVTDIESGVRLADGNKSVQDWLRQTAFDLEGEADLEALFKNAVGVPQGLMTSDFVGTGKARKAIFDPLLRVEEYEKAWLELLQTSNNIKDRINAVTQEISYLQADVERIPGLSDQHDELAAQVEGSAAIVEATEAELAKIGDRKKGLDDLFGRLTELTSQLRGLRHQVEHHTAMVRRERESVTSAEAAVAMVERTREGHAKVEEARRVLVGLDRERTARDEIQRHADEASTRMDSIKQQIDEKDAERAQAIADAEEAAALKPDADRQIVLENELKDAEMLVRQAQRLEEDATRIDREIAGIEQALESREKQIASAKAAQVEAAQLDATMETQSQVAAQLAALDPLQKRMKTIQAEGRKLRARQGELQRDVDQLEDLDRELNQVDPVAARRKDLETRAQHLREEKIRIMATLQYQNLARADLERTSCPLLELQCPVVRADVAVLDRFDRRVAELTERIESLDAELSALTPRLAEAVTAAERVQKLSVNMAKLEGSGRALTEVTADLEAALKEYADLADIVADNSTLEEENQRLKREIVRLQRLGREAALLAELENRQANEREGLKARRADRERIADGLKGRAAAESAATRIREQLDQLGDPQLRYQRLLSNAERLRDIEETIRRHEERLQEQGDRLRAAVGQLHQFDGLDRRIAEQKEIERSHSADHDLYLANTGEAEQLAERRDSLSREEKALAEAERAASRTGTELEAVESRYDAEEHARVTALSTMKAQELSAAQNDYKHWVADLTAVDRDLERARLQEQRMARKLAERAELETAGTAVKFIRQTIKDAGPAVTETLLQNISSVASDIYAEIMDDYAAELRWERDYEVVVRRGPDDRKFAQLSGGEQMSAALAVRLALLKEMSGVDMAFFDEPTQNMDSDRRTNLAGQIRDIRGFNQLIVISHDDTFEHHTDNLIRLQKEEDETVIEA